MMNEKDEVLKEKMIEKYSHEEQYKYDELSKEEEDIVLDEAEEERMNKKYEESNVKTNK